MASKRHVIEVAPVQLQTGVSELDRTELEPYAVTGMFLRMFHALKKNKCRVVSIVHGSANYEWDDNFKSTFYEYMKKELQTDLLESFPGSKIHQTGTKPRDDRYVYHMTTRVRVIRNPQLYELSVDGIWMCIGKQVHVPSGRKRLVVMTTDQVE
jgi:hypothetical protein